MYQLELDGAGVVDRRMPALQVVEIVDVLADGGSSTSPALEVIDSFQLAFNDEKKPTVPGWVRQSPPQKLGSPDVQVGADHGDLTTG
jgi:hypothetical protein